MSAQEPAPTPPGSETRSVAVLMVSTFIAAVAFVAAAFAIGGVVAPQNAGTIAAVKGALVARVDPEIVDIDTVLAGGSGLAAGTGMVLTPGGEILTNNHVIQEASSIRATDIGNGQTYTAHVIGYDEARDVAVLALDGASGLAHVTLGDSSTVGNGTRVVTIGNAGGLGGTPAARSATVVARDQAIQVSNDLDTTTEHLTQLLAIHGDLQPGDSGGPLVDRSGQVVGMDTAASQSYRFSAAAGGLGFAIEINPVKQIAAQILAGHGSSTIHIGATAFIGVTIQSPYSGPPGAPIHGTLQGTPAANAGLAGGDLITALGGKAINSAQALTFALVAYHPGDRVRLDWLTAQGAHASATIKLASGPSA
ncbi:MAG: trypsin-like peptidase domain-containing protein [Solirubrobacteraceae bacterium]